MPTFYQAIRSIGALMILLAGPVLLAAPSQKPLPVLRNVGIIPVQWQDALSSYEFTQFRNRIEQLWIKIPALAYRFNLSQFDVSAELWSTPQGRHELVKTYELQGFISLTASIKADVIVFSARLLSVDLRETYLHEVETVSRSWALTAISEHLEERLTKLTFRMINRLPEDVNITSVQGAFVTLDKGFDQNLKVSDELDIYRTMVIDTHPATGAWLSFDRQKLGTIRIIEAKSNTAIGQILNQTFEGSIQVGDGAKIEDLPSRIEFKRLEQAPEFYTTEQPNTPILYPKPMVQPQPPSQTVNAKSNQFASNAYSDTTVSEPIYKNAQAANQKKYADEDEDEEDQGQDSEDVLGPPENDSVVEDAPPTSSSFPAKNIPLPNLWLMAQIRSWQTSGTNSVKVKSTLPFWLFNSFHLGYSEMLDDSLGWEGLGRLELGNTAKGSYAGFGIGGGAFYQMALLDSAWLKLGGRLAYYSVGVTSERYGGEDVLYLLPYLKFYDYFNPEFFAGTWQYYGLFDVSPFAFGKIGTRGIKRDIKSYMGWHLKGGLIQTGPLSDTWWGGEFGIGSDSYTFKDTSKDGHLTLSDLTLSLNVGMNI